LIEARERSEAQGGTHASPRAHVRRAHWHTFTRGVGRAERFIKWLPPISVNVGDEDLPAIDESIGKRRPVKLVVDEVHTLEYLPTLYKAETEGRKFGIHLIQGTQNKAQYDARYGKDAATMLSCPRYKILLRCDEPDSARWLSTLLGEEELEKPRTGVTASVSDQGRDSINYSSQTERRAIVSREEIAALPDLAGCWKQGDAVVPFRIDFRERKKIAEGFIQRQSREPKMEQMIEKAMPEDCAIEMVKEEIEGNVWERLKEDS
jgi:Type IV secretion-system coupling protein DNA-binding domain